MDLAELVKSHSSKVALQFSGGRDSLALLILMKPLWANLTVYYCNSGDAYPETTALVQAVKSVVPNFVEVQGNSPDTQARLGWPSDLLPAMEDWAIEDKLKLNSRYSCCYESIMKPMDLRMKEDKITLILRGQRSEDAVKSSVESGKVYDGFQIVFPLNDWTTEQVDKFITGAGVDLPKYYAEGLTSAPDCMHCTAWLEHKANKYLNKHHQEVATEVNRRLKQIKVVVQKQVKLLDDALNLN